MESPISERTSGSKGWKASDRTIQEDDHPDDNFKGSLQPGLILISRADARSSTFM